MSQVDPFSVDYRTSERKQAFTDDGLISFNVYNRGKQKQNSRDIVKQFKAEKDGDDEFSLSSELSSFANDVSILGMKQIVNPKFSLFRRATWLCFVLAGTGFLIYHLWNRLDYYFSNPASVNIRVNYDGSLLFPTVTICNNNVFLKSKLAANNETYIGDLFYPSFDSYPNWSAYNFTGFNWTDFYYRNGYSVMDVFGGFCFWKSSPCQANVLKPVITEHGVCYQFNSGDEGKRSDVEGSLYGLMISFMTKQEEYLVGSYIAGYTILLHNSKDHPNVVTQGFQVAPGGSANVAIKQKYVKNLPQPHGQCADKQLAYFPHYSKINCQAECLHNKTIEKCGCRLVYYPEVPGLRECSPIDVNTCWGPLLTNVSQIMKNCACTEACETFYFEYSVTTGLVSDVSAQAAAVFLNTTQTYVEKNYLAVYLYYKEMSYEEVIQQEAYSTLTLLADIGGALGLILGSTLMTVAEILDFFLGLSIWKFFGVKL